MSWEICSWARERFMPHFSRLSFFLFSAAAAFHGLAGASGVGTFLLLDSLALIDSWVSAAFGRVAPTSFAFRCCNREILDKFSARWVKIRVRKVQSFVNERVTAPIYLANAHGILHEQFIMKAKLLWAKNHVSKRKKWNSKVWNFLSYSRELKRTIAPNCVCFVSRLSRKDVNNAIKRWWRIL